MLSRLLVSCILLSVCKGQNEFTEIDVSLFQHDSIRFIFEYVIWRHLGQIVIFDALLDIGVSSFAFELTRCFSNNGIYSAIHSATEDDNLNDILNLPTHRLGVIVLLHRPGAEKILTKASHQRLFKEFYSWLLVVPKDHVDSLTSRVQRLNLELNSDLVIATTNPEDMLQLPTQIQKKNYVENIKKRSTDTLKKAAQQTVNRTSIVRRRPRKKNQVYTGGSDKNPFYLRQIYKIRRENDSSAIVKNLGNWDPSKRNSFRDVSPFQAVELRNNFYEFPIVVGLRNNSAQDDVYKNYQGLDHVIQQDDVDDDEDIAEMMDLIAKTLNATVRVVEYEDLGSQSSDGSWSGLLGGVVSEQVDISMERVAVSNDKLDQMYFTHNILTYSRNLYLHPTEYSSARDIYITPFSPRLMICVLCTGVILAIMMSVITFYTANQDGVDRQGTDSTIWAIGILGMQGSTWTPTNISGRIGVFFALIFAVIIYNSYAAFITSILSIVTSDINDLDDIFNHNYDVGYVTDSDDEIYLQKQTNELSRIYLEGFDSRVTDIQEGLLLAAKTKYALFSSGNKGRKILNSLSPYECRCQVQEFVLPQTKENLAFPMSKYSPYFKIINLSVFRLKESGSLMKMRDMMYPPMPVCQFSSLFTSANLEDVATAFKILLFGLALSSFLIITEYVWKNRNNLKEMFNEKEKKIFKSRDISKN